MGSSNIGWTDETWNPVTGCSHVSPGCEHCYAETLSLRYGWSKKPWTAQNAPENIVLHPDRLDRPLHWRKPRMVFVNSMSDVFHELTPVAFLDQMFAVMACAPNHTFQVLTKRHERMRAYCSQLYLPGRLNDAWIQHWNVNPQIADWPLPNVWLGVSVEDQRRADERIPVLLETPAAVRWISVEPLLGPIDLRRWMVHAAEIGEGGCCRICGDVAHGVSHAEHKNGGSPLSWVVVGGESGPDHRSMKIEWLESIVEQCREAKVPVFVKQDAGSRPAKQGQIPDDLWALKEFPEIAT